MTANNFGRQAVGRAVRRLVVVIAVATVALLVPTTAWAHVTVDSTRPNGDGTTTVVLSFDHSCTDSPTVSLDVAAADGVEFLSGSTAIPGWTVDVIQPTRVTFLGDPVASGEAAQVEIVARITGVPGQPVRFPTEQRCASGDRYSWTDTAPGAEYPAPEVIATAAILSPSAVPAESGAGRTEVLVGIAAVTIVLGAAGAVAASGPRRDTRG